MFTRMSELTKGLTFYAIVFALVVSVTFLPLEGKPMLLLAMSMPAIATLLMLLVVTRDGLSWAGWASLGVHRAGLKALPIAFVAPVVVLGAASAVVWSAGVATFTPPADLDAAGWVFGLAQGMFQNIIIIGGTLALAEEIGWRGYLLPRLANALGNKRGMALTGFLHGLFHMPIIFLTPFYHPDGNRWIIVPLFLAALTVGGMLYGYLRLSTNSVWPATLAHATHNYFWDLFASFTVATSPLAAEYLAGESGILPIIGYGILAAWLLSRTIPRKVIAAIPTSGEISVAHAAP